TCSTNNRGSNGLQLIANTGVRESRVHSGHEDHPCDAHEYAVENERLVLHTGHRDSSSSCSLLVSSDGIESSAHTRLRHHVPDRHSNDDQEQCGHGQPSERTLSKHDEIAELKHVLPFSKFKHGAACHHHHSQRDDKCGRIKACYQNCADQVTHNASSNPGKDRECEAAGALVHHHRDHASKSHHRTG